ncbi:MAG: hypothetical protein ABEJ35_00995 [Halobacteriaceae archaeon]
MTLGGTERGERLGLVGAASAALGSLLSWNSAGGESILVTPDGGALVVLILAFLAWVLVLFRDWEAIDQLVLTGIGGVTLGVVGQRFSAILGAAGPAVSPGLGLYLAAFGGACLLAGGGLDFLTRSGAKG